MKLFSFQKPLVALALGAAVSFLVSPQASAAKKKTPTPTADASSASTASDSKSAKVEKVNLNTADEKTIAGAKGVGEKLAKELVKNRPYKTWDEVSKVKGVGSGKKLDSLKKVLKLSEGVAVADDKADKKPSKADKAAKTAEPTPAPAAGGAAAGSTKAKSTSTEKSAASALAPGTKININTATAEELDKLPEIGPVKAQAIVEYRNANGPFKSAEDIEKVKGIKEGTFAKIKDYVVVK